MYKNLFLSVLAISVLVGAPAWGEVTVENIRPGQHVAGPDLSSTQMKGSVVLVEFWGTR